MAYHAVDSKQAFRPGLRFRVGFTGLLSVEAAGAGVAACGMCTGADME